MKQKWVKIAVANNQANAALITNKLNNEGIETIIMNKMDSAYGMFGEIEIMVLVEQVLTAKRILQKTV